MTATIDTPTELKPRIQMQPLAPESYRALRALDHSNRSQLDATLVELINIRVSQLNGCAYCIDMHTKDARAAGETEQRIYALNAWRETPFFTPRERAALALAEAATRLPDGPVPDDVYDEAARHFSSEELAQLIWRIAIMNAWNRIGVTTRMVPGEYQPAKR